MLIRLQTPFADVSASELSLALGLDPLPALRSLEVDLEGLTVELRLLGCSHQALVRSSGARLSETVACRPGVVGDLPAHRTERGALGTYSFQARVGGLDVARAEATRNEVSQDPRGMVGVFDHPAGAFTALRLTEQPGAVAWTTWHAYPQSGELVVTESRLSR